MSIDELLEIPEARRDYLERAITAEMATLRSAGYTLEEARDFVFAGYADYALRLSPDNPDFAWVKHVLYRGKR